MAEEDLLRYRQIQSPEDVLMVNLNMARTETLAPFHVSALKVRSAVSPKPLHNLITVDVLRRVPLWDSALFNPHKSGNNIVLTPGGRTYNA